MRFEIFRSHRPSTYNEMKTKAYSEVELVERAKTDLEAFGELVERYRGSITRQCCSRVKDADHAEDLAQEAFIRAYMHLDQLAEVFMFPNWLRRIASNVCNEFARSPMRREHSWESLPENSASEDNVQDDIASHLQMLPEDVRQCVELFYSEEMSYSEIAEALEISEAAVRNRLHRARTVLRREMADMGPKEKSAFTQRVLDKLEQLQSQSPQERVSAAREVKLSLEDDKYKRIIQTLRTHGKIGPEDERYKRLTEEMRERDITWEHCWTIWDQSMEVEGAIKESKRYRSPEMRDALIDIMLNFEYEEVRMKAAGALVTQKDPAAIPYLKQAMENPKNPQEVVAAAKSTITQLEKMPPAPAPNYESARFRQDMETAASDKKARYELVKTLTAALGDPNPKVKNSTIKALEELGDKRVVPALIKLLDDPNKRVQNSAAIALGNIGSKTAVPALMQVLDNSTNGVLIHLSIKALQQLGDSRAVPSLLNVIRKFHGDDHTLRTVCKALEVLASADDLATIKDAIYEYMPYRNEVHREQAEKSWSQILAKHADAQHTADVIEALEKSPHDWDLNHAIARIMGPEARDILKKNLLENGSVTAAYALIELGKDSLPILKEALISADPKVKDAAVCSISRKGRKIIQESHDPEIVNLLSDLAKHDPNSKVRFYAKMALYRHKKSRKQ